MSTDSADLEGVPRTGASQDLQRLKQAILLMFRNYTGNLGIRLWNGASMTLGTGRPAATIVFRTRQAFRDLLLQRNLLRLAEAYLCGEVDIEGDLNALLAQRNHLAALEIPLRERLALLLEVLMLGKTAEMPAPARPVEAPHRMPALARRHTLARDRQAIAFHYDVSNEFYRLWLDERMVYSCAYFAAPDVTIDAAQQSKLEHICRKLRLEPGERLLDIGCGWGALICHAARHYGVRAHGVTLSRQQFDHAQSRIRDLGLQGSVTVELRDYRQLPDAAMFDKVASVGMFEHVGLRNLPGYFAVVSRVLKPGGLFLNHGITSDEENWGKTLNTQFIQRYVFPDGELDTVSNVQRVMEHSGFEIWDVEGLRPHYALTLRHWVSRLEARYQEALAYVSETTYRVWRLYMAMSAAQFERGSVGIYQILATNGRQSQPALPLTREDLYW